MSARCYERIGKDSSTDELSEKLAPPTAGVHHDTVFQLMKRPKTTPLKANPHRHRLPPPLPLLIATWPLSELLGEELWLLHLSCPKPPGQEDALTRDVVYT